MACAAGCPGETRRSVPLSRSLGAGSGADRFSELPPKFRPVRVTVDPARKKYSVGRPSGRLVGVSFMVMNLMKDMSPWLAGVLVVMASLSVSASPANAPAASSASNECFLDQREMARRCLTLLRMELIDKYCQDMHIPNPLAIGDVCANRARNRGKLTLKDTTSTSSMTVSFRYTSPHRCAAGERKSLPRQRQMNLDRILDGQHIRFG